MGVSWRDYVDTRIDALELATNIAREAMTHRLESMNEFRDVLKDQNRTFVTRPEHQTMLADIADLRKSRDESTGKASQGTALLGIGLGLAGIVVGVISIVVRLVYR